MTHAPYHDTWYKTDINIYEPGAWARWLIVLKNISTHLYSHSFCTLFHSLELLLQISPSPCNCWNWYKIRGVQTQTTAAYCIKYSLHWTPCLIYLFQVIQTQTTAAYCRILYLHWTTTFEISFSDSSDTNHGSLLHKILPTMDPMFDISFSGNSDTNHGSLL